MNSPALAVRSPRREVTRRGSSSRTAIGPGSQPNLALHDLRGSMIGQAACPNILQNPGFLAHARIPVLSVQDHVGSGILRDFSDSRKIQLTPAIRRSERQRDLGDPRRQRGEVQRKHPDDVLPPYVIGGDVGQHGGGGLAEPNLSGVLNEAGVPRHDDGVGVSHVSYTEEAWDFFLTVLRNLLKCSSLRRKRGSGSFFEGCP